MFDKFKKIRELGQLRAQAKALQRELSNIFVEIEERGIRAVVSADQKIQHLVVNGEERKDVVEVLNKAFKEAQKKAARKMFELGGGFSGFLGGK